MKLKINPFHCPVRLVATVALLLAALPAAQAANGTWTGGTSTSWATTANWLNGTVAGSTSANADIATFNSGTYLNSPTAANNYFLGGLSFGGSNGPITITTGNSGTRLNVNSGGIQVASGSGAVTIGTSTTGGINLTASQSWMNNSTSLLTIIRASVDDTAALGTYTVTINGSGSGGVNVASGLHDTTSNDSSATRNVAVIINSTGGAASFSTAGTYSGGTTLTAGTLQIGNNTALGTGSLALNGGTLSSGNTTARTILNAITIGGDVTLGDATKTGALTFSAAADLGSSTRTLTTASAATFSDNITGTGGITKAGSGALTYNGATSNTYSGLTTVGAGSLTLAKTAGNAIAGNLLVNGGNVSVTVAGTQIADTATVEVSSGNFTISTGLNETVATVKLTGGNIIGGDATSTLTATTTFDLQSGNNTAILAGAGNATKSTSGTILLSKANTYTGGTTVSTGTLMVNNTSGSGTGTGSLLVSAGATLGGSGAIAGITTISGILAPGNSIGTLTVANDVTWNGSLLSDGTANWKFELGAANTADLLRITGGASEFIKGSGSVFCFDFLGSTETGLFTLVDWDSIASVGGGELGTNFAATDFTYTNLGGGNSGAFRFNGSSLEFQAIPEPSAGVLMALAGTALLVLRRRRMQ